MMNAADVLDRAADVIVERGWCQGQMLAPDGRVCAYGAIVVSLGQPSEEPWMDFNPMEKVALYALTDFIGCHTIGAWNDDPIRTDEFVTKTMRACASSLRAAS